MKTDKTGIILTSLFIVLFVGLIMFIMIAQPQSVNNVIALRAPKNVGDSIKSAIRHPYAVIDDPADVTMTLVHVAYQSDAMELTFAIRNQTDHGVGFVSDYVSCFTDKELAYGRSSDEHRYFSLGAKESDTWTVFVDKVLDDMTVYYMDIPHEMVFASWKVSRNDT